MTLTMSHFGAEDEIFYSDEESSDSEPFWVQDISRYFSDKSESIFSSRLRQNSAGTSSPDNFSLPSDNSQYINSPINQICSGIDNLLGDGSRSSSSANARQPSYSAVIKKEPLGSRSSINFVKVDKLKPILQKVEPKKPTGKVTESALAAGYRFKARDPTADPRYPGDQQLVIGPIPGQIEHDVIYNNLRGIFQSRGPVCFMFIHKSAVKDLQTGKPVKFGYVVFAEKGVAQKVVKEGSITFGGGHKICVKPMGGK